MNIWNKLYNEARKVQHGRIISPFIEGGQVAAALLTKKGNIYVGVCFDSACSLGMCAERNAIANMITHGEKKIDKLVAVMSDGSVGMPCGSCRELMMQLDKDSGNIEILVDLENNKTVCLKELMPNWWGNQRFEEIEESIKRVQNMEELYNEIRYLFKHDPSLLKNNPNYQILKEYLENDWQKDYEMDEKQFLPKELKRGVLSQDGLYNLISEIEKHIR